MNQLNRRVFCLSSISAAGALALTAPPARAQTQPLEVARILLGFPAGSAADALARALAQRLAPTYAKQVIVENRTGAGGQIAATALKTAPSDGSTILFTPLAAVGVFPHTFRSLPYNVDTDFAPVTLGTRFDVALAVGTAVPESVKSVPEFLAWAKANPSRANVGSPAPGSPLHFTIAELIRLSKVELQHVPYRGTVAAIPDLISGTLPAMVSTVSEFVRHIPEGKIRVLGTSGGRRNPFTPQIATFSEQGLKELEFEDYFAFYVPARTPAAQIQALNAGIRQGMAHPAVKELIDSSAAQAATGTPEELTSTLRAYSRRWEAVVKNIGFKAD
jgi:tripartite-type tricarboxylate transporter receptor subunit TctC